MGVTVAHVLNLPALYGSRLVAGREGLANDVDGVGLLEAFDSVDWLTAGKLVVNNGRVFEGCSDQEWSDLLACLSERGVAGMVVKMGRYVSKIPPCVLDRANELSFPLVVPPYDAEPAAIINDVYFSLFRSKEGAVGDEQARVDAVLRNIALGCEDLRSLKASLASLGWQTLRSFGVAAVYGEREKGVDERSRGRVFEHRGAAFREACGAAGFSHGFFAAQHFVAIAMLDGEADCENVLLERAERLEGALRARFPDTRWRIGVGRRRESLLLLSECCKEAEKALAVGLADDGAPDVVSFDEMGFLSILFESKNLESFRRVLKGSFGELRRYDEEHGTECEKTVRAYACAGMSAKKAAERLCVHENTVRYRIAIAKEVLSARCFKVGFSLNFEAMCALSRFYDSSNADGRLA